MRMTMNPGSVSALTGAGAAASNMMSLPVNVPSQVRDVKFTLTEFDTENEIGKSTFVFGMCPAPIPDGYRKESVSYQLHIYISLAGPGRGDYDV